MRIDCPAGDAHLIVATNGVHENARLAGFWMKLWNLLPGNGQLHGYIPGLPAKGPNVRLKTARPFTEYRMLNGLEDVGTPVKTKQAFFMPD